MLMNVVYALASYPAGVLSDRFDRMAILIAGLGFLIAADVVLAVSSTRACRIRYRVLGSAHGFYQGLLATLVADTAPLELRGTAYGMFNLMSGLALLAASFLAGAFWDLIGPQGTFLAGALFATLALVGTGGQAQELVSTSVSCRIAGSL